MPLVAVLTLRLGVRVELGAERVLKNYGFRSLIMSLCIMSEKFIMRFWGVIMRIIRV